MYLISREWCKETPFYFYKTTNLINKKFYYGSGTDEEDYLGSGIAIDRAIKKYGKENFHIEKLRYFQTRKDAYEYEDRFLNLFDLKNIKESYNLKNSACGFEQGHTYTANKVVVKDKYGNNSQVDTDNPRYNSGELMPINKDRIVVKDTDGNKFSVSVDDPKYLSGELVGHTKGKVTTKDSNGNIRVVSIDDERYLSGELTHVSKNLVAVKDIDGNILSVSKCDNRIKSGELVYLTTGMVGVKDINGNQFRVSVNDIRYISGELVALSKGRWTWNKLLYINNKHKSVKEWTKFYGLKQIKYLKEYLESNNINYGRNLQ